MSNQGNQFAGSGSGVTSFPVVPYNPFPSRTQTATASTAAPAEREPDAGLNPGEGQPLSNVQFLRVILQEPIPENGADTDTLFLEQHLVEILNRSGNVMSAAAAMGWTIKAGALAVLSDRNDGLAEKKLSQMSAAASKIAATWQAMAEKDLASVGRSLAPSSVTFRPYDDSWSDTWNQIWDASHIDKFYLPWNVIEG